MFLKSYWCYACNNPFELTSNRELKCTLCQSTFIEEIEDPQARTFTNFLTTFVRPEGIRTTTERSGSTVTTTTTQQNPDGSVTTFVRTFGSTPNASSDADVDLTASQDSNDSANSGHDMFRSLLTEISTGMDITRQHSLNPFNNLIRRLLRLDLNNVIINNGANREDAPRPASAEFVNALPEITLLEADVEKYKTKKCVICLLEYEKDNKISELKCKHEFHSECIKQWLKKSGKCPVCRQDTEI